MLLNSALFLAVVQIGVLPALVSSAPACPFAALHARTASALPGDGLSGNPHIEKRSTARQVPAHKVERRQPMLGDGTYTDHQGVKRDLIGGLLQPLSAALQFLDIPVPQPMGLAQIPPAGDDTHKFIPPGPTDVRGLCPTLNTLANHGYISRTGITTFAEAANAVQTAYGFGYDLAVALSALGLVSGGDIVTGKYSIGGADSRVPGTLGPALGLDTHGKFEIDQSISRNDAYFGDDHSFQPDRWNQLVDISKKHGGLFNRETFLEEKALTYTQSRETNPQAFFGAKWFVVAHAERAFVYRALPNGTTEDVPDFANIGPFFVNETFPHRWFRRSTAYGLVDLVQDILDLYVNSPQEPGGNQGLDNFAPLDLDLPKAPEQLGCFILENLLDVAPGIASPPVAGAGEIVTGFLRGILSPIFQANFNCNVTSFVNDQGSGSNIHPSSKSKLAV